MSFGANPSDIVVVVTFCKALYRKCRDAGGGYDEISWEVKALHTVLRHLRYELEDQDSNLNRNHTLWTRQLSLIIISSDDTLRSLSSLLSKHDHQSQSSTDDSPFSPRTSWDAEEMDTLGTIRVSLISHKKSLTQFLDTVQLASDGTIVKELDNKEGQLDMILDKVDEVAARMGKAGGMASCDGDDTELWKQFRRELVMEGFDNEVLMAHRDVLRAYIREIDQKGLLDDVPQEHTTIAQGGPNPERWLQAVQSAPVQGRQNMPPTFSSLNVAKEDITVKEKVIGEDNMKFPPGMKMVRPQPESRRDVFDEGAQKQPEISTAESIKSNHKNSNTQYQPVSVPILHLTTTSPPAKDQQYLHTDSDSSTTPSHHSRSLSSSSHHRPKSALTPKPELGLVIRTTELIAASQALTLYPSVSPSSHRSSGSFADAPTRLMANQLQNNAAEVEYGSSPVSPRDVPASPTNGFFPREAVRLAPDSLGKEIPPNATWTKINRRLVSPEVLHQDGRRYEARPDFVAVLGLLSRAEIEALAVRSQKMREARRRRPSAASHNQQHSPFQSNMPVPIPIPMPRSITKNSSSVHRGDQHGRVTPSESSESDSESSDSEDGGRSRERRSRRNRSAAEKNCTYAGSDIGKVSGYPNAYGTPPVDRLYEEKDRSPRKSSTYNDRDEGRSRDKERDRARERERERERHDEKDHSANEHDRDGRRRHHHSHSHHDSHSHSRTGQSHSSSHGHSKTSKTTGLKGSDKDMQKKQRWKDTLTGAGIGGAAVSLLSVLSEAAEAL